MLATSAISLVRVAAEPAQTQSPSLEQGTAPDPGPIFRVFLTNGTALASYGEYAVVDDRVIFTLVVGDGGLKTQYQLISLPATTVDLPRTLRYRDGVRAARYAGTRGETDYAAMTAEVERSLDELMKIADPKVRLAAAEEAKRRLLAWSQQHYNYRAKDIQELAGLFDDVISQLRVATGEARMTMDLVAGPPADRPEPVKAAPTLRESIELALAAVAVADVSSDRAAILRAASAASSALVNDDNLSGIVARRMEEEQAAERAWAAFRAGALERAELALVRGDVALAASVKAEAEAKSRTVGIGRVEEQRALLADLDNIGDQTRVQRAALDRYAMMRPQLLAYERELRPALSSLDGTVPVLQAIRDMKGPDFNKLERAVSTLSRVMPRISALTPPEGLVDVHATFVSAVHLAQEACRRRRLALVTNDSRLGNEAAASAAGATMLVEQARLNLVARLYPPKVR